jgi:hypothetical protein
MQYGKTLPKNAGFQSEAEVADYFAGLRWGRAPAFSRNVRFIGG